MVGWIEIGSSELNCKTVGGGTADGNATDAAASLPAARIETDSKYQLIVIFSLHVTVRLIFQILPK